MPFDHANGSDPWDAAAAETVFHLMIKDNPQSKPYFLNAVLTDRHKGMFAAPALMNLAYRSTAQFAVLLPHIGDYVPVDFHGVNWDCRLAFFKTEQDALPYKEILHRQEPLKKHQFGFELQGYAVDGKFATRKASVVWPVSRYGITFPSMREMNDAEKSSPFVSKTQQYLLYRKYVWLMLGKEEAAKSPLVSGAVVLDADKKIIGTLFRGQDTMLAIPASELNFPPPAPIAKGKLGRLIQRFMHALE